MRSQLLNNIVITDVDIDWVESILKGITFDKARRNIITNMDTIDIQAFPGSGKTTVLIAKLAILANRWPSLHKGICVLSHTNVARDEIKSLIGSTGIGNMLLSYPHFIGTIHSFFDTYITLPWLQSQGIKVNTVNSAVVKELRFNCLKGSTRNYFKKSNLNEDSCQIVKLPIQINIGRAGPTSPSYKDVVDVITSSIAKGEITFDEMLLYANEALCKCPYISSHIVNRFPALYIDEAQDTTPKQWNLINLAFPEDSLHVRQCFGDCNQAIFNSFNNDEESNFHQNSKKILTIPDSKRFGTSIASLANCISLTEQEMSSSLLSYSQNEDKHTVFLFDKNNIASVISAYATHVLSCFTDEEISANEKNGFHVIGMVHRENDNNASHFPQSVVDYWKDYEPEYTSQNPLPKLLNDYFRVGKQKFIENGDSTILVDWISKGLRHFFNMFNNRSIPVNTNAFNSLCNELSSENQRCFRKAFLSLIKSATSNSFNWSLVTDEILTVARDIFKLSVKRNDFLELESLKTNSINLKPKNVFTYRDEKTKRTLPLHFGSIHSVKGQTHLSTLVVETFWHKPNIYSLLPWLCGCPKADPNKRDKMRLKCHYVAFTRARSLLCIAIPNENVSSRDKDDLKKRGWRIEVIT